MIEAMNIVFEDSKLETTTAAAFDFNEDILPKETIISRNITNCKEEDDLVNMDLYGT